MALILPTRRRDNSWPSLIQMTRNKVLCDFVISTIMSWVLKSKLSQFSRDLNNSPYFRGLCANNRDLDLQIPPPLREDNLSPAEACVSACREILPGRKWEYLKARVRHALSLLPPLPLSEEENGEILHLNIVVLYDWRLQHGASWTVGRTIVLSNVNLIEHEVAHVVQRYVPIHVPQDRWRQVPTSVMARLYNVVGAVDNPDTSIYEAPQYAYQTNDGRLVVVVYMPDISKWIVEIGNDESMDMVQKRRPGPWDVAYWENVMVPMDHPYEMMANWLSTMTATTYSSPSHRRDDQNA